MKQHVAARNVLLTFTVGLILLFTAPTTVLAENCVSNLGGGIGNWSDPASWTSCGGTFPNATDDNATILAGDVINLVAVAGARQVVDLTINAGGVLNHTGAVDLRIGQNATINGTFNASPGTQVSFNTNPNNKTLTGTGTKQFANLRVATQTLTVAPNVDFSVSGELRVDTNLQADPTSTVTFNGTGTQLLTLDTGAFDVMQLGNIVIGATSTVNTAQVGGNVVITQGYRFGGNFTNNGTFNAIDDIIGFNQNTTKLIAGTGNTQFATLNVSQGSLQQQANNTINISENLLINGYDVVNNTALIVFNGGGTSDIIFNGDPAFPFYQFGSVQVTNNTTVNGPNNADTRVAGNFTVDGGSTFTSLGDRTAIFNTAANNTLSGAGTFDLDNVIFQAGGAIIAAGTTINIDRDVAINTGLNAAVGSTLVFDDGVAQAVTSNQAFSQFGNITVAGGTTLNFNPAAAYTARVSGNLAVNNGGTASTFTTNGNTTVTFNNFSGGNKTISGDGTITFGGDLLTNANTTTVATGTAITVNGNTSVESDFALAGTATATLLGNLALTDQLTAANGTTVTFNSAGTQTLSGNQGNAQFGNVTVAAGATLNHNLTNPFEMRVGGTYTVTGTHNTDANTTVVFNSGGAQNATVGGTATLTNLTVEAGTALTETVEADNITVSTMLTNSGTITKTKTVSGTGALSMGLAEGNLPPASSFFDIATQGGLTQVQVNFIGGNSPNAGTPQQTGAYWNITPTGTGYTASLTLPHNTLTAPSVCQYSGAGTNAVQLRPEITTASRKEHVG